MTSEAAGMTDKKMSKNKEYVQAIFEKGTGKNYSFLKQTYEHLPKSRYGSNEPRQNHDHLGLKLVKGPYHLREQTPDRDLLRPLEIGSSAYSNSQF